ncbi:hypothetical protein [Achromobacter dolens]|uniref:hypothetical protein n=1 Tax=Achromobacter dolens TaxID=1287738 RepID=UPI0031E348CD
MKTRAFLKYGAITLALGTTGFVLAVGALTLIFSPETGTFAPTNGADAAAWIQAVGSILAIVGAFFVGKQQAIEAAKLAEKLRKDARTQTLDGYVAIVLNLFQKLERLEHALGYDQVSAFRTAWVWVQRMEFKVALEAFDRMPVHDFADVGKIDAAFSIHGAAAEAYAEANKVMAVWSADNDPIFMEAYRELQEHTRVYASLARNQHSKLR